MNKTTALASIGAAAMLFGLLLLAVPQWFIGGTRDVPVELVAFDGLSDEEKDRIIASPKDSDIRIVSVNGPLVSLLGDTHAGKEAYEVTFHHTETVGTGPLVVYVDKDGKTVLGKQTANPIQ
ncbi:hypothetical protein [Paenibacillus sp. NPDC058071]|uniref:hypothetical protein n=1 Tax=Paenibacillus sp. NPDC058071 TaxID=3346326 RepID=UPI0036D8435D